MSDVKTPKLPSDVEMKFRDIKFDMQSYVLRKQWFELYGNNYTYNHITLQPRPATPRMESNSEDITMQPRVDKQILNKIDFSAN